jgi:hypothetical protein
MFKFNKTTLIREIQVSLANFWAAEAESQSVPLSVFVQAGMDKDKLTTICNLEVLDDFGYASVQCTVFGKHMHNFKC